jgi:hypothetical protein
MKKCYLLFLLPLILLGEEMNDLSGTVNYYYINRISDGSIINLPFRIADIQWQRENDAFSIYSHLAMEYRMPSENHFLESTSPQDFIWDLRELYLTWQLKNGEFRIGKQIHSWGSVDGNSPVDNLNAFDYYYLFESGAAQKIGSFSMAADFYYEDWKFGLSISPFHHINRLPINDPEFPVGMAASPVASQVIAVNKPSEFGGYMTKSFNKGDVTFSYFDGYDRVFSLAGLNIWNSENFSATEKVDTVFSYRKTEVIGMGTVLFFGNLTFRSDFAYFTTKDPKIDFFELEYLGTALNETQLTVTYTDIDEDKSKALGVRAEYYQANIQFEYELPWDFQIAGQYIKYDTLQYFDNLGRNIFMNVDEFSTDFTASDFFFPGLGTNIAILTKSILLMDLTKTLYDNKMEISIKTMMDQIHSGSLVEMGIGYDISESVKSYLAVTKVFGDKSQDEDYTFNNMEDFSHIRLELKYYY